MMKRFNEYKQLNLSEISKQLLADWEKNRLFEQSVETREGAPRFLFFEGPPSANGMPGIHHVLARSIKDTFCRYKTMRGYQVQRKAGWDTHGLPVELGVEKMLGITKEDIGKKISVDDYNAACRREVMKYTAEWTNLTKQMGYWVDLDNPYITYDNKYIETLWWLLKQLYDKGYLYKGYTIQPYSPAAGTGLSTHELNQPGCYRDVRDLTCTARFKVKPNDQMVNDQMVNRFIIAWTTTPWTLPSNTALCVGPKIDYVEVCTPAGDHIIVAEARLAAYAKELCGTDEEGKPREADIIARYKGSDLVGLRYEPLFPWVNPGEGAFRVIPGDYVTTEDGTGIVHIAPTFGADDKKVADAAGVPGLYMLTRNHGLRPMVDFTGKYWRIEDLDPAWYAANVNDALYSRYAGRWVKNAYDPQFTVDGRYDEIAAQKAETLDLHLCLEMKADGRLLRSEKHVHTYPHCWRTDKPVLYYPLDSWFIRSTKARDEMIALNHTINWQPESTGTGRFGKWLENLNDWNLSRSRYWGTPLPIWRTEDGKEELCIGSIAELMAEIDKAVAAGLMPANPWPKHKVGDYSKENYDPAVIDLHRPYVDNIVLVSPSGRPMHRELDLIDVWFDSGAMPYAQNHYPFENQDAPRTADFISEGVDQTRGWFFTLHAIHTMIEGTVAYRNVISNGLVLDKNGNKMSKRLGNAVDPFGALDTYGPDAVRWYMLTNSSPWDNLRFDPEGVDEIRRKFFGTLYNTYSFFALYANVDGWQPAVKRGAEPTDPRRISDGSLIGQATIGVLTEIDRWILSKLNSLVRDVTEAYETYEPTKAGRAISDFVQDDLSNWYVRLNRKRYWGGDMNDDKQAAYYTLYTCLRTVAQLMAPIAPFYADRLYRDLCDGETVHLSRWPQADTTLINPELERQMQLAQQATSMILALRKRANKKVKQPLQKAVIPAPDAQTRRDLLHVADLIRQEVNVKELQIVEQGDGIRLVRRIKPNFKVLGKKVGAQMKAVAAEIAAMNQDQIARMETEGTYPLTTVDYRLVAEDVDILTEDMPGWLVANEGLLTIALDIEISEELAQEGIARELINRIQNLRKSSGLEITDRIDIRIADEPHIHPAVLNYRDYIMSQVLGRTLELAETLSEGESVDFDDFNVQIQITKA
ncbi:MAG: isoleucine--tRNA ligase [Paludibacteraceae bacterium]|nr:isoleucine--tRNA ligase [Paludibacteraceae bacterium]